MTYQESIVAMTESALDSLIRAATAVPVEKADWRPMDVGRTVTDQLAECVQVANWFEQIYREKSGEFFTLKFISEQRKLRADYTYDRAMAEIGPAYEAMNQAMRNLTEADIELKVAFKAGSEVSLRDACYFPLRNLWYHFGQVNYIQTLYGDQTMH